MCDEFLVVLYFGCSSSRSERWDWLKVMVMMKCGGSLWVFGLIWESVYCVKYFLFFEIDVDVRLVCCGCGFIDKFKCG